MYYIKIRLVFLHQEPSEITAMIEDFENLITKTKILRGDRPDGVDRLFVSLQDRVSIVDLFVGIDRLKF